jgi:predicted MPP superfamily phosphohydrolase
VDDGYVIRTFDRVAARSPDIVVCTGDWITYRGPGQVDQLRRLLDRLPHGRLGTVGILGNHDYGYGWRMAEVANAVADAAGDAGVRLLRNEACEVAGLRFLGLDDLWGPNFAPGSLLQGHDPAHPAVALCHNPDGADRAVWSGYRGWILSGHTHGGQCKPPFLAPPLLPVQNKRYTAGEFALSGERRLYISRGVGHLIRARFNVRPEVPVFRLRGHADLGAAS